MDQSARDERSRGPASLLEPATARGIDDRGLDDLPTSSVQEERALRAMAAEAFTGLPRADALRQQPMLQQCYDILDRLDLEARQRGFSQAQREAVVRCAIPTIVEGLREGVMGSFVAPSVEMAKQVHEDLHAFRQVRREAARFNLLYDVAERVYAHGLGRRYEQLLRSADKELGRTLSEFKREHGYTLSGAQLRSTTPAERAARRETLWLRRHDVDLASKLFPRPTSPTHSRDR